MPIPSIDSLPTAPARTDTPDIFIARADAFVAALPPLVSQINAWSAAVAALAAELGVGDAADSIAAIAALTPEADALPYFTGADTAALADLTPFARTLLAAADGAAVRALLALAGLATVNTVSNSEWFGTDLAVSNGGTGASTASAARSNLGLGTAATADAAQLVPAGTVITVAMSSAPTGYLKCDGSSVLRATYADLFTAIGTTFGSADGTHFTLPDLRGEFVRGYDDGRGIDSGRVFGSAQADELLAHTHSLPVSDNDTNNGSHPDGTTVATTAGTATTGSTGGAETRPRNVALLYCIKT